MDMIQVLHASSLLKYDDQETNRVLFLSPYFYVATILSSLSPDLFNSWKLETEIKRGDRTFVIQYPTK